MSASKFNESQKPTDPPSSNPNSDDSSIGKITWGIILVGLLGLGGIGAWFLATTGPEAERNTGDETVQAQKVDVMRVSEAANPVQIQGHGSVEASRKIQLVPQVSGKITARSDSFRPGGFFDKGDTVLQIEREDYRIAVEQRKSELQQAQSELTLTESDQAVAEDEYERIRDQLDVKNSAVVLKEPQLKSSKAAVDNARAALEKARLNLERTSINAPFDAHVTRRDVELGMSVSQGQRLATLVGTDEYWVKLSISVSKLRWITDDSGNLKRDLPVKIYNSTAWNESTYRRAYVKDLVRELETKGRMAKVLVAITDPLALGPDIDGKPSMMVGSYVKGVIEAGTVPGSVKIDRSLIRNDNTVWVATEDGTLDIREVSVAFVGKKNAIVKDGLQSGDRIITSDLSSPVDGMAVTYSSDTSMRSKNTNPDTDSNRHPNIQRTTVPLSSTVVKTNV